MNGNVNVGFTDSRNSSRVLKPPGGDTSDIFAKMPSTPEKDESKITNKSSTETAKPVENGSNIPKSENSSEEPAKEETKELEKGESEKENKNDEELKEVEISKLTIEDKNDEKPEVKSEENKSENLKKEESKDECPVIEKLSNSQEIKVEKHEKRGRIPPGGYSSGLW